MQPKLAYKDESAWEKGDLAYEVGDTMEIGIAKAAKLGIKPGVDGYAAFITAFARRIRSGQLSPTRAGEAGTAVVLTPDFSRA
jgi:hypothetical protein